MMEWKLLYIVIIKYIFWPVFLPDTKLVNIGFTQKVSMKMQGPGFTLSPSLPVNDFIFVWSISILQKIN